MSAPEFGVLTKNALWVAVSTTLAAICLWTAIMTHEASSRVEVGGLAEAIVSITQDAKEKVDRQDAAGQEFVNQVGQDLRQQQFVTNLYCRLVDFIFNPQCPRDE